MSLDIEGEKLLEKANFKGLRQRLIQSVMENISKHGVAGQHIDKIIEESLREDIFKDFVEKLARYIDEKNKLSQREKDKTISTLVEEDIKGDLGRMLPEQLGDNEVKSCTGGEKRIYKKGQRAQLWKNKDFRQLIRGDLPFLEELRRMFEEQRPLLYIIMAGFLLLLVSAVLFGSLYQTIITGLTLTALDSARLSDKFANVMAGLGGVLLFFTSISILVQYMIIKNAQTEEIRKSAQEILKKLGKA